MKKIRALVVDDSVAMGKLIRRALESSGQIEVLGVALNGRDGLSDVERLKPDILILDLEMPVLDGIRTLHELRKTQARLPVIMFSSLTEHGAKSTIQALAAGANDYLAKPARSARPETSITQIARELVPKVLALTQRNPQAPLVARSETKISAPPRELPSGIPQPRLPVQIVVVGASTGGPAALAEVLPALPKPLPVPMVIVQHMPPLFTRYLAEQLNSLSGHPVHEAKGGEPLRPGEIWLAPGGYHLIVQKAKAGKCLALDESPAENSCRPAVDVLFRSAAAVYGSAVLAVVLTGMGNDGARSAGLLRKAGATVFAQDEASSVVWGMPRAVVEAGFADKTLSLSNLGRAIADKIAQGAAARSRAAHER